MSQHRATYREEPPSRAASRRRHSDWERSRLRFSGARPTVTSVIIGARNEEQLRQNLGAVGWNLTGETGGKARCRQRTTLALPLLASGPVRRSQSPADSNLKDLSGSPSHLASGRSGESITDSRQPILSVVDTHYFVRIRNSRLISLS